MVSIIIPIYNTKTEYIERCVESILAQSVSDIEIILIDNGSQAKCAEAVDRIAHKDMRITVYHTDNKGVSVARNYATERASGEYVMYVDADDLLERYAVEDGLLAAEKTGCEVIIGKVLKTAEVPDSPLDAQSNSGYTILDSQERRETFRCHIFTKGNPFFRFADGTQFNGEGCWAHLIKRETALKLPFPEGVSVGEDTIWALNMLDQGASICLSNKLWYYYIQNEYSILNKYNPFIIEQLSQPVGILNKKYLNADDTVYCAYMAWILSKLRSITHRYFLSPYNKLTHLQKRRKYKQMVSMPPWRETLNSRSCLNMRLRVRIFLYKHQFMLYIQFWKKKFSRRLSDEA